MTVFHIFLVIVGLGIIAVSYMITDKVTKNKETEQIVRTDVKDLSEIREKIEMLFSEIQEEKVQDVETELERMSNEKIISVTEYSQQILEKIEQNHSEVVFLYDMLNTKENDIKNLINQIDKVIAMGHEYIVAPAMNTALETTSIGATSHNEDDSDQLTEDTNQKNTTQPKAVDENKRQATQIVEADYINLKQTGETFFENSFDENEDSEIVNHKETIIEMHQEGKTVIEIAKALELGQGEVSLVIGLFKGVNK